MSAPTTKAPDSKFYRRVTVADVLPITDKKKGLNCSNYESIHFEILPSGGANPACQLLFWSEAAGRFVQASTNVAISAVGADVPHVYTYDVKGQIVLLAVTTLASGSVDVYTSGFGWNHDLG